MKTSAKLKGLNYNDAMKLNQYFNELISKNKLNEMKHFLRDYPPNESFYEETITNNRGRGCTLFDHVYTLTWAAQMYEKSKDPSIIHHLFDYGLKANYTKPKCPHINALLDYIEEGGTNIDIIKLFVSKGERFDVYDRNGWSMLHFWAYNQQAKKLEVAIKGGANINILTISTENDPHSGETPLMFAAKSDKRPVSVATKILVELGADVNAVAMLDGKRITALDLAYDDRNQKILQDAGAKGGV